MGISRGDDYVTTRRRIESRTNRVKSKDFMDITPIPLVQDGGRQIMGQPWPPEM